MPGNSFGQLFRITTFGESHGAAIGLVVDGVPAGMQVNEELIREDLSRRKPGQSHITTQRKEKDNFEILSGIFEGQTTGAPMAFIIRNEDYITSDYDTVKNAYRPSHADFTYETKYGIRDHRGGGRSSARETAARVIGGAVAKMLLQHAMPDVSIRAYVSAVGEIRLEKNISDPQPEQINSNVVRCPDAETADKMIRLIEETRQQGDTVGGVVSCVVRNVAAGLGEPVFDKLHADLAKAMMSINAAHGFDYGSGFAGAAMKGSAHNDVFKKSPKDKVVTSTNWSGGIQGGISNGMDIYFRVAFKPVSTLMQRQQTLNREGKEIKIEGKGRHDPCVVPRAVPIVEAMAAIVLADHMLRNKNAKVNSQI